MLKLARVQDGFGAGVAGAVAVLEERGEAMNGEVTVLVHGAADDSSAMFPEKEREIGAAAKQADTEGCAGNNHDRVMSPLCTSAMNRRMVSSVDGSGRSEAARSTLSSARSCGQARADSGMDTLAISAIRRTEIVPRADKFKERAGPATGFHGG